MFAIRENPFIGGFIKKRADGLLLAVFFPQKSLDESWQHTDRVDVSDETTSFQARRGLFTVSMPSRPLSDVYVADIFT